MPGTITLQNTYPLWYDVIMAKIPLGGKRGIGKYTIVDDEDVIRVASIKWHLSDTGYAVNRSNGKTTRMHRVINNTPNGLYTDHKNHDRLDNRKSNLRTVTQAENMSNHKGGKGYCWSTEKSKWLVRYKGRHYSYADTEEEAKELYKKARSGIPRVSKLHPRRKLLPKGVFFMQPMAEKQQSPYYIRPQINGLRYFKGYFKTIGEAEKAYKSLISRER